MTGLKNTYVLGCFVLLAFHLQGVLCQEESTPCGTVIDASTNDGNPVLGQLVYKPGVNYEANERCVWTIRASPSDPGAKMGFRLDEAGFESEGDKVVVDFFNYFATTSYPEWTNPFEGTLLLTKESVGVTYLQNGTVAIISFTTEGSSGKGFILSYQVTDIQCNSNACKNIKTSDVVNAEPQGSITQANETMSDYMFSTYVLPPSNFQFTSTIRKIHVAHGYLQSCPIFTCCDAIWVYSFTNQSGLTFVDQICATDPNGVDFESDDTMVFVLKSDSSSQPEGFTIEWE